MLKRQKSDQAVQLYHELGRIPRLTREDEKVLAVAAQHGDTRARKELVTRSLRIVMGMAWKFHRHTRAPIEDLIQEGVLGLFRAVNGYDPETGNRFSTYAIHWVMVYMRTFARKSKWTVHVPLYRPGPPGPDLPIDDSVSDDSGRRRKASDLECQLIDILEAPGPTPEEEAESSRTAARIVHQINGTPKMRPVEQAIVYERLMVGRDGSTLEEIGIRFGLSGERIRQIETKVKDRLRKRLRALEAT